MKLEYQAWKELNPNQDFSQKEYQQAIVNTRAFEYESIRDTQENKEFWFQIGALVVIIGATLICPPAGMALGAVYGAYELSSAVSGKDLVSGRELETSERWVRGLLAPLDIVPGVSGLTKFSSTIRLAGVSDKMGKLGLSSSVKGGIQQGASRISNLVETASKFGTERLRRAEAAFQNGANIVKNKVIKDTIEAAQVADKVVTGLRNYFRVPQKAPAFAGEASVGKTSEVIENTHTIENGVRVVLKVSDEVKIGSGGTKGTGDVKHLDDFPRIKEIEVNFKRNVKHDSEEFERQLKDQEKGMNELTVEEYLQNRERYIAEGRAIEGNAAQKMARQEALKDKIAELRKQGLSRADATKQASEWLETKAALHNPDQIAGGRADMIGGLGDK